MDINDIIGLKLIELRKKGSSVKLYFKRLGKSQSFELSFNGLLFETSTSATNKLVESIHLGNSLGFKALTQLRYQNIDTRGYKQLLIQMEGSTEDYKIELICVFKEYTLKVDKGAVHTRAAIAHV